MFYYQRARDMTMGQFTQQYVGLRTLKELVVMDVHSLNDDIVDVFDHLYWEGAKPIRIFQGIKHIQGFDSLPYKFLFVLLCVWLRSSHDVSMQYLHLR